MERLTTLRAKRDELLRANPGEVLALDLRNRALVRNARLRDEGTRNLVEAAVHAGAERLIAQTGEPWPGDEQRLDLTHQHCVTIDDPDTRDIDDGSKTNSTASSRGSPSPVTPSALRQ